MLAPLVLVVNRGAVGIESRLAAVAPKGSGNCRGTGMVVNLNIVVEANPWSNRQSSGPCCGN